MTEQEWAISSDPITMLGFSRDRISDRKLRLFAVACCRRMWADVAGVGRETVAVAERLADGLASREELATAAYAAERTAKRTDQPTSFLARSKAKRTADWLACWSANEEAYGAAYWASHGEAANSASQARILRDIVGSPWKPVTRCAEYRECCGKRWLNATGPQHCPRCDDLAGCGVLLHPWITRLVLGIASEAYESRNEDGTLCNDRLAVLSDAMEDAGCAEQSLLSHLRSPGVHYRGMWSLDCVLGKE